MFLEGEVSPSQMHGVIGLWLNAINHLYVWTGTADIYSCEEAFQNKTYAVGFLLIFHT